LQAAFHTGSLDPWAWPLLALWPVLVIGAEEARKAAFRRWVWTQAGIDGGGAANADAGAAKDSFTRSAGLRPGRPGTRAPPERAS
jgi:hypothetical protein